MWCQYIWRILGGRAKFPSIFCTFNSYKPKEPCEERTIELMRRAWADREFLDYSAKDAIGIYAEPRWNIIGNVIPVPMTLHILLGLFNKAFTEFTKTLDELEKADLYREWVEKLHISRKKYFGGVFEGNAVRKMTKFHNYIVDKDENWRKFRLLMSSLRIR